MKKFKITFSSVLLVLLCLCALLFISGFILAILNLVKSINKDSISIIIYSCIILLDILLSSFLVALAFFSKYTIDDKYLTFSLGFLKTKYEIKSLVEVNLFKKTNKLVVYLANNKYFVVIISPKNYDEFILSLREKNRSIIYDEKIEDNEKN